MNLTRSILDRIALHPRLVAVVLGAAAATGFAPLGLWPITLLGLAGLIELVSRAQSGKQVALIGWLFGLGHFLVGNSWIAIAFTYQAQMPVWLGWIAVLGIACFLSIYPALAACGAWAMARKRPSSLIFAFAACWIVSEWLRSWVFSGFAWNPLGVAALGGFSRAGLAVLLPWFGTYALSGLVVLLAGCWWLAVRGQKLDWRSAVLALGPALLFLMPTGSRGGEGTLPYTLIQPDVRQDDLNNAALFEAQFIHAARLSLPRSSVQRRIIFWPESGLPDFLREGYPDYFYLDSTYAADPRLARARLGRVAGPGGLLLTGAVDLEFNGGRAVGARNAVTVVDEMGAIRASYAKAHLVPGGEYLPLRPLLEPLGASRLVAGSIDFWPGPGPRTLELGPWGKAGVQICYEIIFSGQVVDRANRPDYIFNPSNDGWFGSWGPPQHLAQARLRAIEEGLPVLRSTTTGISAVIDADGIVRQHLPRHTAGRLDGLIPPAHPPTLFARVGNVLALGWALVLLVLSAVATRRR